jgi:hypothetical protein
MIKNVHINNPKPFLRRNEFRADAAHSRRAFGITGILERLWLKTFGDCDRA